LCPYLLVHNNLGGSNEVIFHGRLSIYIFGQFDIGARTDGERSKGIEGIEGRCQT
jgi:hypothetical protein